MVPKGNYFPFGNLECRTVPRLRLLIGAREEGSSHARVRAGQEMPALAEKTDAVGNQPPCQGAVGATRQAAALSLPVMLWMTGGPGGIGIEIQREHVSTKFATSNAVE
jgi:hypothetical protein